MRNSKEQISISAKNYANALIEVLEAKHSTFEEISRNFDNIREILNMSPELEQVLNNPTITTDIKKDIVKEIFKNDISETMMNFIKIIIDKKRFCELSQIHSAFIERLNEIHNIQPVTVISTVELSEDSKLQVIRKLEEKLQKTIQPEWKLDTEIIAGLVIHINDNLIDMSIRNRLAKLKKDLMLK